jgi:hypothetical protein
VYVCSRHYPDWKENMWPVRQDVFAGAPGVQRCPRVALFGLAGACQIVPDAPPPASCARATFAKRRIIFLISAPN